MWLNKIPLGLGYINSQLNVKMAMA